jgi:predicted Zn-dependent protease
VPNYSAKLDHRLSWTNLPVRVFFVPDKNYRADLETIAKRGFDHWTRATLGFARYVVVRVPQQADIFVRFNPGLNGGLTKTHFRKGRLYRADMTVGVAQDETDDVECTAAHEFGHALGIDGHSDDRADLMFPVHVIGRSFRVTESDVNTLAMAYDGLAKRLAAQREARAGGPVALSL